MLKWNLKATAMPWERHTPRVVGRRTPRVVDRHTGEKIPLVVDKLTVADKSLVVEKSLLVDHSKWTLMFEMIKGMQQNQVELAESLRQLREANGNKEDHQNKNDNRNHEERESHNKNDTPFVTMSDVADLLKQERERPPKEPRHFVRRPPYPIELLKEPYPEKYDTPVFALFDGRKGSAMEHISKFLDSMGPFAAHGDLCLREFSKSLVDRAYTCKYFHVEEKITLGQSAWYQAADWRRPGEVHPPLPGRVLGLSCEVSRGGASGEKPPFQSSLKLKKPETRRVYHRLSLCPPQAAPSGTKRKNPTDKAYEEPPPLPFTAEEMMAIFDKWVQDQVIKLPKISKQPTAEEQKNPKYCRYHRYVNHPTVDCRTLRWEVNRKIQDGTLTTLPERQQKNLEPLVLRRKLMPAVPFLETTNAITFTDEDMEVQYPDHRRPLYLSAVVKDVQVRRALVDTGSCLNLIPLSTLQAASVPQQKIQGSPMEVTGFGGMTEHTMGHVQLVLKVGPIVALTRFHVVNAETPYHVLLDVFAWDYHEMPGIDPGLVAHSFFECGARYQTCGAAHENLPYGSGSTNHTRAVTAVFTPLMKKGVPFVWSTACQQAFEKIQLIMTKLPTVCAPVPGRPLRLYLASNTEAIGGLVAQEDEDGTEKPIYYTPTAIKSQAIADLLAQFPGEDSSSISHEVPGEIGEVLLAEKMGETIAKSFKLDFSCSNNASEYEAYITGLAIAHEMGIKHLRVIGDSNLIICQTKGEFSLKEPSLALYRALAQKLEEKFDTFEISHAMRCENRYADALATLGSQVSFEGSKVDVTIDKRSMPITDLLREKFKEQNLDAEDWRIPIKAKLMSPEGVADLKVLKDYVLIAGDLYRRLPGGVLARCVNLQEAAKKLIEVHEKCCEFRDGVSLYRRLQRLGYFWPSMSKEAASLQEQCSFCQHQHESDQIYATFVSSDWRTPFLEYLIENILPQTSQAAIRIKKLATRYFVEGGILFRKGFHGDPLRCLSLAESQTVMKEAHSGECGEHQGKKRLYQLLLTLGYYWPTMKKDTADFNMATPWPFHTWGLDLIGPINPSSGGYIWILVATEYFSKWVEAIPLRKATGAAVANFIREHIITRFGIPHKIISDNGTPFVNKNVREVLEHYRIKHRRSTPYYPQGNGQAEATNRMLLRILSKMVFDYGKGWSSHLADTLWAYRGSTKTATGFTPFSLVYGTDAISPTELLVPSPRILHGMDLEADADICAEARVADLESLEEARELASSP
uniref:Integrase catalytic domain-containing protein n=1 Tax=Fagus sylvatica TaxID=28930 RepID=A0A2N9EE51_FAGSY